MRALFSGLGPKGSYFTHFDHISGPPEKGFDTIEMDCYTYEVENGANG